MMNGDNMRRWAFDWVNRVLNRVVVCTPPPWEDVESLRTLVESGNTPDVVAANSLLVDSGYPPAGQNTCLYKWYDSTNVRCVADLNINAGYSVRLLVPPEVMISPSTITPATRSLLMFVVNRTSRVRRVTLSKQVAHGIISQCNTGLQLWQNFPQMRADIEKDGIVSAVPKRRGRVQVSMDRAPEDYEQMRTDLAAGALLAGVAGQERFGYVYSCMTSRVTGDLHSAFSQYGISEVGGYAHYVNEDR